ncbi:MAG: hypothetical protein R3F13_09145 [Prosthecobacter sp.]
MILLPGCGPERYDSKHPTVSQQDAYDVSWGLPPRKSRGNPQLRRQYRAPEPDYSSPAPQAMAPPLAVPTPAPASSPAPAPISPTIPSSLR